ncbi:MAG: hypothetical protein KDC05_10280, partial [Bacteroidales bacterium]|nr:hypothetical protein [Bacteroidales bacterium]
MRKIVKLLFVCLLCLILAGFIYVGFILIYGSATSFNPEIKIQAKVQGQGLIRIDTSNPIRLVSWNIGYAGLGEEMDFFYEGGKMVRPTQERNKIYLSGIASFLESQAFRDFILLQEVDFDSKRSYGENQFKEVAGLLPAFVSSIALNYKSGFVPVPFTEPMGRVEAGLVTFSKYQPVSAARIATPGSYAWPMRLFQLKRCFLVNRFHTNSGKDLVLIHLHNSAFDDADELREQELGLLKEIAVKAFEEGNYVIAAGDWNQNPPQWMTDKTKKYEVDQVRPIVQSHFPSDWTWAFDPSLPTNRDVSAPFDLQNSKTSLIDFYLLSPNIKLLQVETIDLEFENSDHLPVTIEV